MTTPESITVSLEWAKKLLREGRHRHTVSVCKSERASPAARQSQSISSTSGTLLPSRRRSTATGVAIASRRRTSSTIGPTENGGWHGQRNCECSMQPSITPERSLTTARREKPSFSTMAGNVLAVGRQTFDFLPSITSTTTVRNIGRKLAARQSPIGFGRMATRKDSKCFATTATWRRLTTVLAPTNYEC